MPLLNKYSLTTIPKSQSAGVSISIDSNLGVSNIIGFAPIRAFVLAKASLVKIYKFEFSSNQGYKSWVRNKLLGS